MRYMYHATPYENLASISSNGLKPGRDGIVYLCEQPNDAVKFLAIRMINPILVCKIKIYKKDESKIIETFDHSERFFKCRAFGFKGDIPWNNIVAYYKYGG